jgi:hypothetical protein
MVAPDGVKGIEEDVLELQLLGIEIDSSFNVDFDLFYQHLPELLYEVFG